MTSAAEGFRKRADALRKLEGDALKKHGSSVRKELIKSAKAATGGNRRFSGMGDDVLLGVTLRTLRGNSSTSVTLKPSPKKAKAPWVWIQYGTRPGRRAKRRSSREIIATADGPRIASRSTTGAAYFHPGTDGSDAWFGPVEKELPKIREDLRRQFDAASR